MTVRTAVLKQHSDYINGALRQVISCHDLFASSLKHDQHNHKLQSQRGGLRNLLMLFLVFHLNY